MSAGLKLTEAGHDLIRSGRLDLAWRAVALARDVDPGLPNAQTLRAHLLETRGDFAAALAHWREAVRLLPASAGHRFNLALALLRDGALAEGFRHAEARLEKPDWVSLAVKSSFAGLLHRIPRAGEDLSSRRVLAFTEQGLGDNIWAARWLPVLRALSGTLDLACRPALRPLLSRLITGDVIGPPAGQEVAKLNMAALAGTYDSFVPLMSLPHVLGVTQPEAETWLAPDPARVAAWRQRYHEALPGMNRFVGIVWRANPETGSAASRFVPPETLHGLHDAGRGGIGIINLQGGAAEGRTFDGAFDPLANGEPPLDDYAAMIAATDLLLTADTMAAHLAGAMGHNAIVATPALPNFYWGSTGDRSPWYASLRLIRQAPADGWAEAGAAMVQAALAIPVAPGRLTGLATTVSPAAAS